MNAKDSVFVFVMLLALVVIIVVAAIGQGISAETERDCELDCMEAGYPEHRLMNSSGSTTCFCIKGNEIITLWEKEK